MSGGAPKGAVLSGLMSTESSSARWKSTHRALALFAGAALLSAIAIRGGLRRFHQPHAVTVHHDATHDVSPPLASLLDLKTSTSKPDCGDPDLGCGNSAAGIDAEAAGKPSKEFAVPPRVNASAAAVEQRSQGPRLPAVLVAHFEGLGVGFEGPQGSPPVRNPSDNSLAVGPNHIVQIVNTRLAIFTKKGVLFDTTGKVIYGAVATNTIFAGFGGPCELRNNGDAVVRYDQLAQRWLYVMPIFSRPPNEPEGPYSMCYAVSTGADPVGPYYRYEFKRPLFPDYPRPAVWPDGYYVPTSTSDDFIQKHLCVVDRTKMLLGLPATEQCMIIDGVNFLNNADIDGYGVPPVGAPNIMMAAGGAQLNGVFEDDGIYAWQVHVDWDQPANTGLTGPAKIGVAPYHYLCNGQLTSCVPQPDTGRRLDAQGDKIMQRLVYRNLGGHESIVALHSVNSSTHGGGVRWYEFRLNEHREPRLYQQGTYAPDRYYRWMGSIDMDRQGNIGMGYSFGGTPHYPGQRFAARLSSDPLGVMGFRETVLVEGEASQKNTLRWEDYATTAMDPSDDCTFWYVGDYLRPAAPSYSSRIGGFRLPGCLRGTVSGASFFDRNHDGRRTPDEPGLPHWPVTIAGGRSSTLTTDPDGNFSTWLPADVDYGDPTYLFSAMISRAPSWTATPTNREASNRAGVIASGTSYRVHLKDRDFVTSVNFGNVCVVKNRGGAGPGYWRGAVAQAILATHDSAWRILVDSTLHLVYADGSRLKVASPGSQSSERFRAWLSGDARTNLPYALSKQLAATALNIAFGRQVGNATVPDPVGGDWPTITKLISRVSASLAKAPDVSPQNNTRNDAEKYHSLLAQLNTNLGLVTPASPADCARPF